MYNMYGFWCVQVIDEIIGGLHSTFEKQWVNITQLNSAMAAIPQIISSTQTLMEQLGKSLSCTWGKN